MTRIRSISAVQLTFARLRPARRGYTPGYGSLAVRCARLGRGAIDSHGREFGRATSVLSPKQVQWAVQAGCVWAGPVLVRVGGLAVARGAWSKTVPAPRRTPNDQALLSRQGPGWRTRTSEVPRQAIPVRSSETRGLMADTQNVRSSRRCPAFVAIALNGAWARRREVLQSHGDTGSANAPLQQHN